MPVLLISTLLLAFPGASPARSTPVHSPPPAWFRLMNYRETPRGWESEVDAEAFFLASDGKNNPYSEWRALVEALRDPESRNAVLCRFPARSRLVPFTLPAPSCPSLLRFKHDLEADEVSLVFSSYYVSQPASAFGHVFLKFSKKGRPELLDVGVSYAANADTSNPLLYAWRGLTGGFKGVFSMAPYFVKVAEYNDVEARDLWEYKLDLGPDRIRTLTEHLWELGHAHFEYFYLNENCGYQILSLLNAVLPPEQDLMRFLPAVVLPVDVVRAVARHKGLVKSVSMRPSAIRAVTDRLEALSREQKQEWLAVLGGNADPEVTSTSVLDAALDFLDARYSQEIRTSPEGQKAKHKQRLLDARQKRSLPPPATQNTFAPPLPPHRSHGSHRLGTFLRSGTQGGWGLDFRFALHDPLDPPGGSPPHTRLEFLSGRTLASVTGIELEELALFRVGSSKPVSLWETPLTWEAALGWEQRNPCNCPHVYFTGAVGLSWSLTDEAWFSVLGVGEQRVGTFPGSDYLPSVGAALRVTGRWSRFGLQAEIRHRFDRFRTAPEASWELRHSAGDGWSVWGRVGYGREQWTHEAGIHWYL